jgi:hypothetical protein
MAKIPKVPTGNPELEQTAEAPQQILIPPVQIIFHAANLGVAKVSTPDGLMTEMTLISPTGIGVSVRMNQEGVDECIKQLSSGVEVHRVLPPGLAL